MELRAYLDILRRRWKLIVAATLIVAVAAGVTSSLKTPLYTASARVLLRPGETVELLNADRPTGYRLPTEADRFLAGQLGIIESEQVAAEAAAQVPGTSAKALLEQVSASQAGTTDVVVISVTDPDPAQAAKVANAFTRAYIDNRTAYAVAGLERVASELDGKLAELQTRITDLDAQSAGGTVSAEVTAAREAASAQYQTLYARQQDLLVAKSLRRGEAELIAEAQAPEAPSSPKPKRDTTLGLVVGLLLGLGFAFLKEQLDERLRSREEAEQATGLPVLAELPFDGDSDRDPNHVAAHHKPSGAFAEAARGLRTSLTFLGVDEPLRRVVVTSAGPAEGKSTVAANLAAVYAQSGKRTVLVSADLRRPRLGAMFSVPAGAAGLTDVIAGLGDPARPSQNGHGPQGAAPAEAVAAALQPTPVDGLLVLPAGKLPPNPAELLGSQKAAEVLDALTGLADMVVIDTPPVLAVTDAAALAPRADGVVVVAAAGQTHKGALARAASTLAGTRARMLGLVFNKEKDKAGSGYYGGSYYRGYYGDASERGKASRLRWKRSQRSEREEAGVR